MRARITMAEPAPQLHFHSVLRLHCWTDGRNATLMQELERHGAAAANAREQLHWLCAPLNVAALAVLLLIATLSYRTRLGRITNVLQARAGFRLC